MAERNASSPSGPRRRQLLAAAGPGAAALLAPGAARAGAAVGANASNYPSKVFRQKTEAAALKLMFGKMPEASAAAKLTAPRIAENGAVVPVIVDATLPGVTTVAIIAKENPFAMACAYRLPPGTSPAISSQVKLAKTTDVVAVFESGGKLFSATKNVKVTLGGCG
ncbi:MAG: thiosulfate oxidation carrier protein SoxY [Rhodospirillales bacterium]|nr:thiosulfate oxidation carrier protein SoxY [Rhodospirillales bacterium]